MYVSPADRAASLSPLPLPRNRAADAADESPRSLFASPAFWLGGAASLLAWTGFAVAVLRWA